MSSTAGSPFRPLSNISNPPDCGCPVYRISLWTPNSFSRNAHPLQQQLQRVLEHLLELTDPLGTNSAVNYLVVEAGGDGNLVLPLGADGAILVLDGHSDLLGGTNGEDSGLRRVDDGGEVVNGGVHTHVGDGDGAALVFLGLELVVASLLGESLDLVGNGLEATALDASDDGGDESIGGRDGNGDIDSVVLTNGALLPARIDGGVLLGGNAHSLDQEVVDRELVLALSRAVEGLAELEQLGDGDVAGDEEVGVLLGRLQQTVGNGLAHAAKRGVLKGSTRSSNSRAADSLLDVLLRDLAALASALEVVQAHTLLAGQAQGLGIGVGLTVEGSFETTLGGRVLLGLGGGFGGRGLGLGLLLLLLLGSGSARVTAGVLESKLLEGRDVGTLLDKNSDGLSRVSLVPNFNSREHLNIRCRSAHPSRLVPSGSWR